LLIRDVPPYSVVVGVSATVKKMRFDKYEIEKLCKIEWWEWDLEKIRKNAKDFRNVRKFIKKWS